MRLLLDTHTLLWFLRKPEKLPEAAHSEIVNAGRHAAVSLATLWEIVFKMSLNKLYLPDEYEELFPHAVTDSGLSLLPIEPRHLATLRRLPHHHRDPFDRLIIAQAKTDTLTLVSRDSNFSRYDVPLIW